MSEHDESLDALLESEREAPGMPEEVASRLAARFGVSLAPTPTSIDLASTTTNVASTTTSVASASLVMRGLIGSALFALGVGSGIFVDRTWLSPRGVESTNTTIAPARRVEVVTPIVTPEPAHLVAPAPLAEPVTIENLAHETEEPTAHRGDTERLWMERAEAAFGRGDARAALAALAAHRRHFPDGRMREERDALEVRALVLEGNGDEAARRAARFEVAYPRSIFLRQIQASLRSVVHAEESSTDSITPPQTPSNPPALERTPRTP